ncbi:hypothetical protein EJD97_017661 [Solanum chilense]|uniref:Uncharacterized protein n=1 Tax=Solanum chilense TaxID=4083 RepID=A0A6N2CEL4_SOLCI|nr:hypothetical protein EJD97_017661 [Solanum chilense]
MTSGQDKAKAMIFLRHNLGESLEVGYLTVKDPLELWIGLKGMYDHLKATKNHEDCPAGSALLTEAHAIEIHGQSEIRQNNQGHDNVRRRDIGKRQYNNRRVGVHNKRENNIGSQNNPSKGKGDHCHRCGLKDDIQAGSSQKYIENVEANLALKDDAFDGLDNVTHLKAEDFFGDHN